MSSKNNDLKLQIANDKIKTFNWINGELSPSSLNIGYLRKNNNSSQAEIFTCLSIQPIDVFHQNIKVKKATLSVNALLSNGSNLEHYKIGLYRLESDIFEGEVTPDSCKNLIDYECISSEKGDHTLLFDITRLIDKSNFGKISETNIGLKIIDDCDAVAININNPKVEIIYEHNYEINTSNLSQYHSIGRFGRGKTDLLSGKLEFFSQDFSWAGRRMPVTINHKYNSAMSDFKYSFNETADITGADFSSMNIGLGWRINLMQCMQCYIKDDITYWIYIDENGHKIHFKTSEKTTIDDNDSKVEYNLYEDEKGIGLYYDDKKRNLIIGNTKLHFDNSLRLVKISDTYSSMNIEYVSNQIKRVIDGAGRSFTFNYNSEGFLGSITAPDKTEIIYEYIGDLLSSIIYPDETKATITYSSSNKPESVVLSTVDGELLYKVVYVYKGDKVESVTEYTVKNGNFVLEKTTNYSYDPLSNRTTVILTIPEDEEGVVDTVYTTVYSFNDDGRIIGCYTYSNDSVKKLISCNGFNTMPNKEKLENNVDNLLINHEFNGFTAWALGATDCEEHSVEIFEDEQFSKYGKRVLALQAITDTIGTTLYQDSVLLPPGEYTFSSYVRPSNQFEAGENGGIYLKVESLSEDYISESEIITQNYGDFVRVSTSFTLKTEQSVRLKLCVKGNGTVYFNAPQLENNSSANQYNLLVNSNFEHELNCWNLNGDAQLSEVENFNMLHSLRLGSDLNSKSSAKQDVSVKSLKGTKETFVVSAWAKAFGLPKRNRCNCNNPEFNIAAVIKYVDGTKETYIGEFSPCTDEWQPTEVTFAKKKYLEVESLTIECNYGYNFGFAYFDDIRLFRKEIKTGLSEADFVSKVSKEKDPYEEKISLNFKEAVDEHGNKTTITRSAKGQVGTIYRSREYGMEKGNDLISQTDTRGFVTKFDVDSATSRNIMITDRCGNKKKYEYDSAGRTKKITHKNAVEKEVSSISYGYDNFNNIKDIIRDDGMQYSLVYNGCNNLESIGIGGIEKQLVTYAYNKGNTRIMNVSYANGYCNKVTYNSNGQIESELLYQDEVLINEYRYTYDGMGRLVSALDILNSLEYNYTYDNDKIIRFAVFEMHVSPKKPLNSIEYVYAKDGKLIKKIITDSTNTVVYMFEYSKKSDPTLKIEFNNKTIECRSNTDMFGRIVFDEIQIERGFISREFGYCAGKISKKHIENRKFKSAPTTALVKQITFSDGRTLCYDYDGEDRITKIIDSIDGVTEYTYDTLGQLLTETHNDVLVNSMTYDNYGNILTKNGVIYSYDEVWKDKLISLDNKTISYDAQGNPINYLGHVLTWQKGRELATYDDNVYTYNMYGVRTSKMVNNVRHDYVTSGIKVLRETWGANTVLSLYDNSDFVCGIVYNGKPYYFIKNLQSDIIAIANDEGETVAQYGYDAWGKPTVLCDDTDCRIATINPYRYRGYYYDIETGLYYLQSRYYDPNIGRFINADDPNCVMEAGENLYAYCNNSTVGSVDYLGYCSGLIDPIKSKVFVENTDAQIIVPAISNFVEDTTYLMENLEAINVSSSIISIREDDPHTTELAWISLRDSSIVVFYGHGSPFSINGLNLEEISSLFFKQIDLLILLSCNAGHYSYVWENVGYNLKQKISGKVVSSDGEVTYWLPNDNSEYNSEMLNEWTRLNTTTRTDNLGWIIYNDGPLCRFKNKKVRLIGIVNTLL